MNAPPPDADGVRRAAAVASAGQRALREAARAGTSELELWDHVAAAMTASAGAPVQANVDLLSGPRTALVDGRPSARRIAAGESILLDLAPRIEGWWADSCSTVCAGSPGAELRRRHAAALRALERGIEAARPGLTGGELDAIVRNAMGDAGYGYEHHSGHGVGVDAQQPPWVRPGSADPIEEGTILALEPGCYGAGVGVRLEHLVVVAGDGARLLTDHPLSLT